MNHLPAFRSGYKASPQLEQPAPFFYLGVALLVACVFAPVVFRARVAAAA
jgi:hypothetical protein